MNCHTHCFTVALIKGLDILQNAWTGGKINVMCILAAVQTRKMQFVLKWVDNSNYPSLSNHIYRYVDIEHKAKFQFKVNRNTPQKHI